MGWEERDNKAMKILMDTSMEKHGKFNWKWIAEELTKQFPEIPRNKDQVRAHFKYWMAKGEK